MISEHSLNAIRERVDIVDIVGEYVQLKKSGQGFQGLCPFHREKSPSFHVHTEKQLFRCFGCQKGGNVFTFLMNIEGLTFPDAAKRLASRAGIEIQLEDGSKPREPERTGPTASQSRMFDAHAWAARYFHYLLTEKPEGKVALDYLYKRGIEPATIRKFMIGVAPSGWQTLQTLLLKRGFTLPELIESGLIIAKETGGYDRFRDRLMFPILDVEGRTIGFGARLLKDEPEQPKYINSPESPIFLKRQVLYGLYENIRGIRTRAEAILVEGYMDVIGLHQAGVQNAVATLGTALSEDHARTLKKLTRKVVTVFDSDAAGIEASRRSTPLFLSSGMLARDLVLPEGLDPDEYVLKEGADSFYKLCDEAPRQVTKLLQDIATTGSMTEEGRARWLVQLTPILVASRRLPERATLWDSISLVLKISVDSLRQIAEASTQAQLKRPQHQVGTQQPTQSRPAPLKAKPLPVVEAQFLRLALLCPDRFRAKEALVWKSTVQDDGIRGYLECLASAETTPLALQAIAQRLMVENNPELSNLVSEVVFRDAAPPEEVQVELDSVFRRLLDRKKSAEIQQLKTQIHLSEQLGQADQTLELLSKVASLRAEPQEDP